MCAHDARAVAAASRYVRTLTLTVDPLVDASRYVGNLATLVTQRGIEVVIPVTDQSCAALLPARERLAPALVAGPDADAFWRSSDKSAVLAEAAHLGIATPKQVVIENQAALALLDFRTLPYPIVLKPASSVRNRRRSPVLYAADECELRQRLAAVQAAAFPLLLQQRIVGPGSGIFLLIWDHQVVATFAHRRLREFPPSGGASTYCEAIAADPELVELSRALLDRIGFQGVAMVEYKIDSITGTPYLMEVNGRLWGSLQLAVDAGVDFPSLLVDAALGRPPSTLPSYVEGMRLRSWWRDVDQLLTCLRRSPSELSLPPEAPRGRWRLLFDFLAFRRNERLETLRASDPLPFVRDTANWVRGRLGQTE